MFVTKKGSNLRRPVAKPRRNVVLPQVKKETDGGNSEYFTEADVINVFDVPQDSSKKKAKDNTKKIAKKEDIE